MHLPSPDSISYESGAEFPFCGAIALRADKAHPSATLLFGQHFHGETCSQAVPIRGDNVLLRSHLHVVELYAGVARSCEPFREWNQSSLALLVDNNPLAKKTYLQSFPKAPYLVADLTRSNPNQLLSLAGGRIDILLGCPPCQGFSDAGAKTPNDSRNSHMDYFGRFAEKLRPLAVGMENVPLAAGTSQFRKFVKRMERAGYVWTAGILNGALRGSSQSRQRLAYIAIRGDLGAVPSIPPPSHGGRRRYFSYRFGSMMSIESDSVSMLGLTPATQRMRKALPHQESGLGHRDIPYVEEALDGLPRIGTSAAERLSHRQWNHTRLQLCRMARVPEGGRWRGGLEYYSQCYGRLHRKGLARTITTFFPNPGSGRFWHPTENRTLTIREAARIQGFPDSFLFLPPYSKSAVLVGNALDLSIASTIYSIIRDCLS